MGCERIDYCSDEEYQQALQYEQLRQEQPSQEDVYYNQLNEFEDWLKYKHKGCLYSAAKELDFPLDENTLFYHWLNPSGKEAQKSVIDDLPF